MLEENRDLASDERYRSASKKAMLYENGRARSGREDASEWSW
jgi:hypothetical protein